MPFLPVSLAFQILFAVHAWRTGRDRFWIYILLLFPVVGCALYFIVEILPEIRHGQEAHKLKQWWSYKKDPDKDLRAAQDALAITPTVAHRLALARVLMARSDYAAVVTTLQPALEGHFADDPAVLEGLAYAYYHQKDYGKALEFAEQICHHESWTAKDYIQLLRARLLQLSGQLEAAKLVFKDLARTYAGEEAKIDYARLLTQLGETAAAQEIYADIVRRAPYTPKHYQAKQKPWIDEARGALKQ